RVRMVEFRESITIARQVLDGLPEGPISSRPGVKSVGQVRVPKGDGYARVEGARGEVGCYLVADGGPKPYRLKWRGASFSNLSVGPHVLLQPIADAIKLMLKEDVVPTTADRWVYNLAPIVFLVPCVLIFATLPFAPGLGVADLNIGVLFFLAVSSLEIVGLFMGGWGSNNKYALLSAMRAVNQI